MKASQWIAGAVILIVLIAVVAVTPQPLSLATVPVETVLRILGTLFLVALCVERSLDVFLTTFRGVPSASLDFQIRQMDESLKLAASAPGFDRAASPAAHMEQRRHALMQEKHQHRARTGAMAMWLGLAAGVIVSALGFRVLHSLLDPAEAMRMGETQKRIFELVDVIVTGGVIGGGSDGVHKLIEAYRGLMASAAKKE